MCNGFFLDERTSLTSFEVMFGVHKMFVVFFYLSKLYLDCWLIVTYLASLCTCVLLTDELWWIIITGINLLRIERTGRLFLVELKVLLNILSCASLDVNDMV